MASALSRMMKKAAASSSVILQLVNRTTTLHRSYTSAIFGTTISTGNNNTANLFGTASTPAHNHFSSLPEKGSEYDDTHLLSVIESDIEEAEKKELEGLEVVEVPRDFPFKILDHPGEKFLRLSREYQGEEIKIKVHGPNYPSDYEDDQEDKEEEEEEEEEKESDPPYVYLNVSVTNRSGRILEFHVSADHVEGFTVGFSRLEVKYASHDYTDYEEPSFNELSANLQNAFQKYLEVRGFEFSNARFLFDYMNQRKHKKYSMMLTNLKNYITDRTTNLCSATQIPTHHDVSDVAEKRSNKTADDNLLSVLESEIGCAEEKFREFAETPREFPFKIEYKGKWGRSITLTREYQGEDIEVTFEKPYKLIGSVSNKSGLTLKFEANAAAGRIKIESLDVKNGNASDDYYDRYDIPYFPDLDENFQNAFRTYLEVRGIEPSITKILTDECVVKNKHKKYTEWLKNLKSFIASTTISINRQIPHHHFSCVADKRSNSDETLLSHIESDINDSDDPEVLETPREFPFKIVDNAKDYHITLTREYQGEEIKVKISGLQYLRRNQSNSIDDEKEEPPYAHFDISFSKKSGITLHFGGAADADGFIIRSNMTVRYPNVSDRDNSHGERSLHGNSRKAFYKYLEVRGLGPSTGKFLLDYMVERKRKKDSEWLKNLNSFIAK